MNREVPRRARSVLSGLGAIALTSVLAATLVESVKPVLILSSGGFPAPINAAVIDIHGRSAVVDGMSAAPI
jgi:hypothetical protein